MQMELRVSPRFHRRGGNLPPAPAKQARPRQRAETVTLRADDIRPYGKIRFVHQKIITRKESNTMKTQKQRRNRRGFTLVELIVVIAILAILAGVAIPVYSGYIKKAQEASDLQQLDAIKTAAVYAYTESQTRNNQTDVAVNTIKYPAGGTTVMVNGEDASHTLNIKDYTSAVTFKSDTYTSGASWSKDTNLWVGIN